VTRPLAIDDLLPGFDGAGVAWFDRQPMLFRGVVAGRPDLLPTSRSVDEILQSPLLPAAYVRITRDGVPLHPQAYTRLSTGVPKVQVVDPGAVLQSFRSGATISINDVHELWPPARAMLRPLAASLACRTEAVLFATPAGKPGFAPHMDPLGVVIVQGEGSKSWRVWPTRTDGPRTQETFDGADLGEPLLATTLVEGDVLYLPHGTPHAAAATKEQSVHASLGIWPRTWQDLVAAAVGEQLRSVDGSDFVALTPDNLPALGKTLGERLDEITRAIHELGPETVLGNVRRRLLGALLPAEPDGLERARALDGCSAEQPFWLTATPVSVLGRDKQRAEVAINGIRMRLPTSTLDEIARQRREGGPLTAAELCPQASPGRALAIAKQLARVGLLAIEPVR
jgi:hypothetical protein